MQRVPAGVAQSAEQPSCKRQVSGSNPLTGSQLRPDPSASMPGRNRHSAAKSAANAPGSPSLEDRLRGSVDRPAREGSAPAKEDGQDKYS